LYLRQRYAPALDFFTKAIQQNAAAPAAVKIAAAVCSFHLNDYNKARGLVERAMAMDVSS
jgi:tetratricopeptide (TPR) repeat protein